MKNALLRFFLPPAYATLAFMILAAPEAESLIDVFGFGLLVLIYAYIFAGVPALLFAFIMGRIQRRGFRHGGVRLLTGAMLGLGAGFAIGLVFGGGDAFVTFLPMGGGVGLLVELTVALTETRNIT